jgi:hypothetical protein
LKVEQVPPALFQWNGKKIEKFQFIDRATDRWVCRDHGLEPRRAASWRANYEDKVDIRTHPN